jgi:hypothetical protein
LTEELRKRNRITSSREQREITQKRLATFRRENDDVETILRQQRHDRETKAALIVLEGGKNSFAQPPTTLWKTEEEELESQPSEATKKIDPYKNLLVLRRIEL